MKIGFVLVNFNNVAYTKNAILSILYNKFTDTKIIIVDNFLFVMISRNICLFLSEQLILI